MTKGKIAIIIALLSMLNSVKPINKDYFEFNMISLILLILALLIGFLNNEIVIACIMRLKTLKWGDYFAAEFYRAERSLDEAIKGQSVTITPPPIEIETKVHPIKAEFSVKSFMKAEATIIKGSRSKIIEVLNRPDYKWYPKEIIMKDTDLDEIIVNNELAKLIKEGTVIATKGVSGERIFGLAEKINGSNS